MPFEESQFHWRSSTISYHTFGNGKRLLIAFHGFDQNKQAFDVFEPVLKDNFKVVSVDLPFQGKTIWNETQLSTEILNKLVQDFLLHLNHPGKVSLMAYSLGGNYALGFAVNTPNQIDELWLIAADGLKNKPAFSFLTKTFVGQKLFELFVRSARLVKMILYAARSLRIIPAHVATYYLESISTPSKRSELRQRWMSSARIAPKQKEMYKAINSSEMSVKLIFGAHDNVIPVTNAIVFKKNVPKAKLRILEQGHNLLKSKNIKVINDLMILNTDNQS